MPRRSVTMLAATGALGAAGFAYSLIEAQHYRLRQFEVPVLRPGAQPLRLLHISDIHLLASQRRKAAFLSSLADLEPDLVVDTGDNLGSAESVAPTVDALQPLLSRPGAFVFGSNDYYASRPKNPVRYLLPDRGRRIHGHALPWRDLRDVFLGAGWFDASNRRGVLKLRNHLVEISGVDDPHLQRDHYDAVAGAARSDVDVAIGLVHAPYPAAVSRFSADGFALVLSGHTHGGQLRVPFYGALVSNCGLDRPYVRWLNRWDGTDTWLHVSAGLGTSPYTPVRFACPPEATLLTLVAR